MLPVTISICLGVIVMIIIIIVNKPFSQYIDYTWVDTVQQKYANRCSDHIDTYVPKPYHH